MYIIMYICIICSYIDFMVRSYVAEHFKKHFMYGMAFMFKNIQKLLNFFYWGIYKCGEGIKIWNNDDWSDN